MKTKWYWNPEGTKFNLYDHNGKLIKENIDYSGNWTGDYPDKVIKEIRKELDKAVENNNDRRRKRIHTCIQEKNINQGKPKLKEKPLKKVKKIKTQMIKERQTG